MGNYWSKHFLLTQKKYADFDLLTCPLKKGSYMYKDFPISEDFIPQSIPNNKFQASFILRAQVPGKRVVMEMSNICFEGEFSIE